MSHSDRPGVVAVLLHYRTPERTRVALRSLRGSAWPLTRILLVNNDDRPLDLDLNGTGPPVSLLHTERNLGYSGGMNVGIRAALEGGAGAVLLVNSDVVVPATTVTALIHTLQAQAGAGIVGPIELFQAQPCRIASSGLTVSTRTGRVRLNEFGRITGERTSRGWIPADAVSGAMMLVSRSVFERIGLLSDEYFFSFEDVEFCVRARRAGFSCGIADGAVVYHERAASIGADSPRRFYFAARNHLLLASAVCRPQDCVSRAIRSAFIVSLNVAHAFRTPGPGRLTRLRSVIRGIRDYVEGRFGPGPEASGRVAIHGRSNLRSDP